MPADVETMFSHREVPWHGIGTIVEDKLTAKEALIAAGLDWEVDLYPVFARMGGASKLGDDGVSIAPDEVEVPDTFAVVRDKDWSTLGVVGSRYVPVQNWKTFEFFDTLVESGDAKYETAGALGGGRKVWMTATVPREIMIAGADPVNLYLLLANSHDGSMQFTAAVTPVRVVCQNTLNLALSGAKQAWRMRHTDAIDGKIVEARQSLELTFKYADEFEAQMNALAAAEFTKAEFEKLVKKAFPSKDETNRAFSDEQYAMIGVLESSPTIDDGIRYTKWGALNAVREYEDWGRSFRQSKTKTIDEQRTEAAWFGRNVERSNAVLKQLQAV